MLHTYCWAAYIPWSNFISLSGDVEREFDPLEALLCSPTPEAKREKSIHKSSAERAVAGCKLPQSAS